MKRYGTIKEPPCFAYQFLLVMPNPSFVEAHRIKVVDS